LRGPLGFSCRPTDIVTWVFAPLLFPVLSPLPPPLDSSFQLLAHRPTFPGCGDPVANLRPRSSRPGCLRNIDRFPARTSNESATSTSTSRTASPATATKTIITTTNP
jgi:hypothetical protein